MKFINKKIIKNYIEIFGIIFLCIYVPIKIFSFYHHNIKKVFHDDVPKLLKTSNLDILVTLIIIFVLIYITKSKPRYKIKIKEHLQFGYKGILEMFFLNILIFTFNTTMTYFLFHYMPLESSISLKRFLYLIFTIVILIPIQEELIYRQIIMNKLRKYHGFIVSIIIGGLVFGLSHKMVYTNKQVLKMIISGNVFLFPYLYLKYKSIVLSILSHGLNNFLYIYITRNPPYTDLFHNKNGLLIIKSAFYISGFILISYVALISIIYYKKSQKSPFNTTNLIVGDKL